VIAVINISTSPLERLRSIVMSMSVCASVCPREYLQNHTRNLYQIFGAYCVCPWLGPPPAKVCSLDSFAWRFAVVVTAFVASTKSP